MKQLKVRDLMVTGAFAALYFLCVGLGTLVAAIFDRSGNMMYAPAFAAILGGPVYMLLLAKVGKFGSISLVGAVMACFFFMSGYMAAAFLPSLVFGIGGDLIAKQGQYKQKWFNTMSFVVFSFGNLGPIILMWLMRDAYVASLVARGKSAEYIARVMVDFTPVHVLSLTATIVVGALLGAFLGQQMLAKSFKKSGLLE
ncbi:MULTISPECIES: MptD family putative ECF transporter S component [unclassified Streptococcus]|uniref:MptD family putative ECF transporter S component n=1 Tax=unclassified Streptococcus TaxID=2608887 RepID=UPI00107298AD|nr:MULTISPECIES: MptD family putative ECF transporter S component [unclassified Streptococcus]MBF0787822.1 MptD family putative ECF transporter S component [Streptococcus sp. 19428wC2_LYSM12]MCQ9211178.1 MptD family putative ECF transporter S component [Streptococcus sp. B01]MCQ9214453.1 MptD family putative ECF transporter S component [Streptococcus sp. O1]TFV05145.1 Trep_Strep domain-containing protein [Streptococcus sp. LYSM12]